MAIETFHQELRKLLDAYIHYIYSLTRKFPKEELFGVTSQLRRSSLSVALNYIEGFARKRNKVQINFLEISYGSLKESRYLIDFAVEEGYITRVEYEKAVIMADKIGAMLWGILRKL